MFICTTSTTSFPVRTSKNWFPANYTRLFFPARDSITRHTAKNSPFVSFNLDRPLVNGLTTNETGCIWIPFLFLSHQTSIARNPKYNRILAVGTGFEPARGVLILRSLANFRLKPLGHPTKVANYTRFRLGTKPTLRYNMH